MGTMEITLLKTMLASYNSKLVVPSAKPIKAVKLFSKAVYKLDISTKEVTAHLFQQEGQHPLTGQRAANFRVLANQ